MTVVERSLEQQMSALEKANFVRFARVALRRNLRAGSASIFDVLSDPAPECASMKVRQLLLTIPWWGGVKVDRFMVTCRVSHSKTVGGLSERQRSEIAERLRARGIR